jgi:hypothetical protein
VAQRGRTGRQDGDECPRGSPEESPSLAHSSRLQGNEGFTKEEGSGGAHPSTRMGTVRSSRGRKSGRGLPLAPGHGTRLRAQNPG